MWTSSSRMSAQRHWSANEPTLFQEEAVMDSKQVRPGTGMGWVVCGLLALSCGQALGAQVESIEYRDLGNAAEIQIRSDEPLQYESQNNTADNQVVLTLKGARLGQRAGRRLDTSSFDGPVSLISPFKGDGLDSRVVVQLKSFVEPQINAEGNLLRLVLPKAAQSAQAAPAAPQAAPQAAGSEAGNTNLDQFMESQSTKRFSGRPVTIQVRDAELADVLRLIAEASGFNILVGEGVGGKVTLSLVDVPWDQALDVILTSRRLGGERKNNILRITTLANLAQEKEEQLRAKLATERSAPRVTRVFPISFADIKELQTTLKAFSENNATVLSGSSSATSSAASIQLDARTNSLIVQDTFENLEKFRKLVELLDTPTPQVLIEAKVVEASEDFNKSIKGALNFSRINAEGRGLGGAINILPNATLNSGLTGTLSDATAGLTSKGGAIGYSPSMAFLPNLNRLNLLLGMEESEENAKVVSSPKLVVLNKKTAKILKGTPTTVETTTVGSAGTTITRSIVQANLSLDVTPTVTNSGSVLMTLKISRDTILNSTVAPRNIETEVLVDSGSTLVIGGIYSTDESKSSNGFPVLRDLPVIGWLFGGRSSSRQRSELFIFVTPKILSGKSEGLISAPQEVAPAVSGNQG